MPLPEPVAGAPPPVAMVVGGSQGIGFSVARLLVQRGWTVAIAARGAEKLEHAATELGTAWFQVDVTQPESVHAAWAACRAEVGLPDLVVNCAGYAAPGFLNDLGPEDYRGMVDCNYLGTVHVAQAVEPAWRERGSGHLVNTASMAGFLGLFGYSGYCGSKFAVMGFSEALRREWRPYGLSVSVLCPPTTRTPGLERENQTKPAEVWEVEQNATAAEPDDVARALLRGLARGRAVIHPTWDGWLSWMLQRHAPWALGPILNRRSAPS